MATISINIPDPVAQRVTDGICGAFNYALSIEGVQNPPTKAQFAKAQVIDFIKTTVKNYEAKQAEDTARSTVSSDIDSKLTLT